MATGAYDHPAFLSRLFVGITTTAGASGTSGQIAFPTAMRLRNCQVTVRTAGSSATTGNKVDIFVGTASVGSVTNGTSAAGSTGTSGDLNTLVPAGTVIATKNGTDATGVAHVVMEMHIDPTTGTWS